MKIVLSHPQGSQFVRATLSAFEKAGQLLEFNTTLSFDEEDGWMRILPVSLRKELLRRSFPIANGKINTYPFREIVRMIAPRMHLNTLTKHETGWASVDQIYHHLDDQVSKRLAGLTKASGLTAVYAYEDGALQTFRIAKQLGLTCVYDLPIAYWETGRRLLKEEAERLPQWAVTLAGGIKDSAAKHARKVQELELADVVVVPGSFVADSLPLWAKGKKTVIAPFGTPVLNRNVEKTTRVGDAGAPLRVLFVGSMGQRKGLGDLFEAMKILNRKDIELIVLGSLLAPLDFYKKEYPDFTYEPGRPHAEVLELMSTCDVFCLPSIVEGRALVMQEAMSQQLPLIITPNTGGADLIIEGETGFLVPIRAPELIAERLTWFLDNRDYINEMGEKAQRHAAQYTWGGYGDEIVGSMNKYVKSEVNGF